MLGYLVNAKPSQTSQNKLDYRKEKLIHIGYRGPSISKAYNMESSRVQYVRHRIFNETKLPAFNDYSKKFKEVTQDSISDTE